MKPLSTGVLAGLLFASAFVQVSSSPVAMNSVAAYDGAVCTNSAALGSVYVAPGSASATTCTNSAPSTLLTAPTDSTYKAAALASFASNAKYVIVSKFNAATCTSPDLTSATFYNADGNCHPVTLSLTPTSTFFKVSTAAIGAAPTITFYTTNQCSIVDTNNAAIPITRTQLQTTTANVGGCVVSGQTSTQYEVSSNWPVALSAATINDGASCSNPVGYASISTNPGTCSSNTACSGGAGAVCTLDTTYKTDFAQTGSNIAFGTTPHVIVSKYASGSTCVTSTLASISVYAADGNCHKISSSKYFIVVVTAGGATATIKFYNEAGCLTAHSDSAIEVTQAKVSASQGTGCDSATPATRYEFSALWHSARKATTSFDDGDCTKALGLVSVNADTCTTDTACASATGVGAICTTNYNAASAINTAYGTTPYVTVSTYSGNVCTWSTLTSAKAYAADGRCHKVGSDKYYKVVFSAGTDTATIKFFTSSTCATAHADADIPVTQTILSTSGGCDGLAQATKFAFSSSWPTSHNALTISDDNDCTKTGFISVAAATCTTDTACDSSGGAAICTADINYELAVAAAFGSTKYLTIAAFTAGNQCAWSSLTTAKAYLADGSCHKYATGKAYKLTVVPLGSATDPKIVAYSDETCTTLDTTAGANTTVTKGQIGCDDANGKQVKVSAGWPKAMSVSGVGTYTVPATGAACVGGAPARLTLTDVSASGTSCGAIRTCATTSTLSDCTTVADHKTYLDTAFGTVPYLVKKTYAPNTNCGTHTGAIAYAADGSCYVDGADSFKVVVASGSVSIKKWASSLDCGASATTTITPSDLGTVTVANLVANTCTSNTKYYMGGSWTFASNAVYDDSKCALTPNMITFGWTPTCAAPTADTACAATITTGATPLTVYNASACSKPASANYFSAIGKAFGMTTYVVQESYTSASCNVLTGVTAYLADSKCHLSADASSSYNVTYDVNSTTAAVKIQTYTSTDCTGTAATSSSVASANIGKTCAADFTKTYVGGLANKLTAVTTFEDSTCKTPVQTVFSSPVTTCAAVTACTSVGGGLFTKQACTNSTDYPTVLTNVFGTTRRLVTDIYEAKDKEKCGTRQGIVAYVGDGICHKTLDASTFFKVTLGATNSADASFSTFSDTNCTKDESKLPIAGSNLAGGLCDSTSSIKFSVGGAEPPTDAPATDAPTPAPTTAVSTGSGKSAAVSSFSMSIFGLLASVLGGLSVLLN